MADKEQLVKAYNILAKLHDDWAEDEGKGAETMAQLEDALDCIDALMEYCAMSEKWRSK